MNARQRNRQYMLRNLIHFLDDKKEIWENEVLISTQVDDLKKLKTELDAAISLEEQLSLPFSGIRDDEREDFNHVFSQLSGILHSMYMTAGQKDKAYLISLTPRELMRDTLEKVVAKGNIIVEAAEEFKEDLEANPSIKSIYDSAKEWQDKFQRNMLLPTERRKLRKQTLEKINDLQGQILAFLKAHLDMNMRIFSSMAPDFFNAYSDFRNVQGNRTNLIRVDDPGGGEESGDETTNEDDSFDEAA